jgi:hypothetical protein
MSMTVATLKTLPVGTRLAFPDGAHAYQDFSIAGPLAGTICETADDCVWVLIDTQHDELAAWDNKVQMWLWENEDVVDPSASVITEA